MHDLTRQIGDRRARQLLLSGDLISAHDRARLGPGQYGHHQANAAWKRPIRIAESLAQSAPLALATTKRLLDEAAGRPRDLRGAAAISAAIRCSEEAREGIRAFVEKRRARLGLVPIRRSKLHDP